MAVTFLTNEDGKKFVKSINDIQPDENGNVQIVVENPDVDLTGYATEKWVQEKYQPKGEYLTEHQDISGKLDADKLPEAINTALAQAKDSGEFDGYTPIKGVDYLTESDKADIVKQAADLVDITDLDEVYILGDGETLSDVPDGITVVIDPDGNPDFDLSKYVETSELNSVVNTALARAKNSGEFDGKDGVNGKDGYTPQKNVDYFDGQPGKDGDDYVLTDADKQEIAEIVANIVDVPNGGNVDLTGYAKEQWVQQNYQPKGNYLTEVPEGYAKTADIPTDAHINDLINTALGVIENGTY